MKNSPKVKEFQLKARMASLRVRHGDLKAQIAEERKRPVPCGVALQDLKRRRLQVKDEIARYEGVLRTLSGLSFQPRQTA